MGTLFSVVHPEAALIISCCAPSCDNDKHDFIFKLKQLTKFSRQVYSKIDFPLCLNCPRSIY